MSVGLLPVTYLNISLYISTRITNTTGCSPTHLMSMSAWGMDILLTHMLSHQSIISQGAHPPISGLLSSAGYGSHRVNTPTMISGLSDT